MRWNLLLLLLALLPLNAGAAPDAGMSGPPAEVAAAALAPAGVTATALPPSGAAPVEAIPAPISPPSPTAVSSGSPPVDPGPAESTPGPGQPTPGAAGVQPGPGTATPLPEVMAAALASPQLTDLVKRIAEDTGDPWAARVGIGTSGVFLGLLVGALLWRPRP